MTVSALKANKQTSTKVIDRVVQLTASCKFETQSEFDVDDLEKVLNPPFFKIALLRSCGKKEICFVLFCLIVCLSSLLQLPDAFFLVKFFFPPSQLFSSRKFVSACHTACLFLFF